LTVPNLNETTIISYSHIQLYIQTLNETIIISYKDYGSELNSKTVIVSSSIQTYLDSHELGSFTLGTSSESQNHLLLQ